MRFYDIPEILTEEQNKFEEDIKSFADGHINPVKFKAIRVAHGVYEQRQEHTYMIRIRCAAGGITPTQLKRAAELGEKYGSGEVHFTTRCEIQVHDVLLQNVMNVIRGLKEVGLSTRGGGGNTIRNILTSPLSGIDPDEVFDVDPYAMELTSRLTNESDSWNLPRKFKIAFSNGPKDTAFTQATCLGYVAKIKDGQKGFEVYCAGGMGAKPMVGNLLFDFIPDTKVYQVARALKIMFDKHGNRRSKFSNRIKFLWKKLQREEFVRLFQEEYEQLVNDDSLNLTLPVVENKAKETDLPVQVVDTPEFDLFKKRYCVNQKQKGLTAIQLPLRLGDLLTPDALALCDILSQFGENTIRCGRNQNINLRNIPNEYVGNVFNVIKGMKQTLFELPSFLSQMINCTGAQTCKLGICLPRGLSDALRDKLSKSDLNLDAIPDFKLNMSGCPNTCGMHHIADLGFFGKIGRKSGNIYPSYNVLAGATTGAGKTEYAQRIGEVAAHHVPSFVYDFLKDYIEEKDEYKDYHEYLESEGKDLIKQLCEKYKEVPELSDDETYYKDFGAKRQMRLDDMGSAECSAGMFDMINVDKKEIETRIKEIEQGEDASPDTIYKLVFHAARMLLVTRGLDAITDEQVFNYFGKHFIEAGIVKSDYKSVIDLAKAEKREDLVSEKEKAIELGTTMVELYKTMDDSLRFKTKEGESDLVQDKKEEAPVSVSFIEKDFRGVACPMNFVKTKLALDSMSSGHLLKILLDDGEPIQNVPNSVKLEGHKVLDQTKTAEGYWTVLIQKG